MLTITFIGFCYIMKEMARALPVAEECYLSLLTQAGIKLSHFQGEEGTGGREVVYHAALPVPAVLGFMPHSFHIRYGIRDEG